MRRVLALLGSASAAACGADADRGATLVTLPAPAIDLGLPVMPNSVFEGMATAARVPTARRSTAAPADAGGILVRAVDLSGVWRYRHDPDERGASEATPWYAAALDESAWGDMAVPSNFARAEPSLADTFAPVWYRRHFEASRPAGGQYAHLRFEGIHYFAAIWLNGVELAHRGQHEGYFAPIDLDVTGALRDGDNVLAVRVLDPLDPGLAAAERVLGGLELAEKVWIKGVLGYHDTRPGGTALGARTAQTVGSGGIWGRVTLEFTGPARIVWPFATPYGPSAGGASGDDGLQLDTVIENASREPLGATIVTRIESPRGGEAAPCALEVELAPGFNVVSERHRIGTAEPWRPWDRNAGAAPPALYTASVEVRVGDGAGGGSATMASARASVRTGFRTHDVDRDGQSPLAFRVDGERYFLRGTNLIPTLWFAEATPERIRADLAWMKALGMNTARIHDHVPPAAFLDAADQEGLLVLDNWTLIWGMNVCAFERPNGDPALTGNVEVMRRMLAESIYLAHHHPSILWWSIHDEPFHATAGIERPPAVTLCGTSPVPWGSEPGVVRDLGLNRPLDDALAGVAAAIDPALIVDLAGGADGDDSLSWYGWYTGDFPDIRDHVAPLPIEYGAQAIPWSAEDFMRDADGALPWPPRGDAERRAWAFHDTQLDVLGRYIGRASTAYDDVAEWILASQRYQEALLASTIVATRLRRFAPASGTLTFDLAESWPSAAWGVLDHEREPKSGAAAVASFMQPVMVAAELPDTVLDRGGPLTIALHVVNDRDEPVRGAVLEAELREETDSFVIRGDPEASLDAVAGHAPSALDRLLAPRAITATRGHERVVATIVRGEFPVAVDADASTSPGTLLLEERDPSGDRHYGLHLTLRGATGETLASAYQHFLVTERLAGFAPPRGLSPRPSFKLSLAPASRLGSPTRVELRRRFTGETRSLMLTGTTEVTLSGLRPGAYEIHGGEGATLLSRFVLDRDQRIEIPGAPHP